MSDSFHVLITKIILCVCNRYWYHISKIPFVNVDRYWSHVQDFQDFIKHFFIMLRCQRLWFLSEKWKSRIWSNNRVSGRFFLTGGRYPGKTQKTSSKDTNCLRRFRCISSWWGVYGWVKRSMTFVGVLANPRNKNKGFLAARPNLSFCISTLKSFRLLAHFLHLALRRYIPG